MFGVREMRGYIPASCIGEKCGPCYRAGNDTPARYKVCEYIFDDDPVQIRHEFTQHVCHSCFVWIMGPAAQ